MTYWRQRELELESDAIEAMNTLLLAMGSNARIGREPSGPGFRVVPLDRNRAWSGVHSLSAAVGMILRTDESYRNRKVAE